MEAHLAKLRAAPWHRERSRLLEQIQEELGYKWALGGGELGLRPTVEAFEAHFALRDEWKRWQRQAWHSPEQRTLYAQLDFAEHHSLPFGPIQTGSEWYANARLGVTVLGITVWDTERRQVRTYFSHTSEQSGIFAASCLYDALWVCGDTTTALLQTSCSP